MTELILGVQHCSARKAAAFARQHSASSEVVSLAPLYWRLAPERGVRPEVGYAQMLKETGRGHFGGVLDASYHNPCGLKKPAGGGDYDPKAHMRFPTWDVGISAHLDHLALYAGAPGYPRHDTADPRHVPQLYGTARTVEALGTKWAPAGDYGGTLAKLVTAMATP